MDSVAIKLEWFPETNRFDISVRGGDPLQQRGLLMKALSALDAAENNLIQQNRIQLASALPALKEKSINGA